MHHFSLQYSLSGICFDSWDMEHLLSLLETWVPAFSSINFTLVCYAILGVIGLKSHHSTNYK